MSCMIITCNPCMQTVSIHISTIWSHIKQLECWLLWGLWVSVGVWTLNIGIASSWIKFTFLHCDIVCTAHLAWLDFCGYNIVICISNIEYCALNVSNHYSLLWDELCVEQFWDVLDITLRHTGPSPSQGVKTANCKSGLESSPWTWYAYHAKY